VTENPPRVYIFHGDDEFSIAQAVDSLKSKLGNSGAASLDISQLDGQSDSLHELEAAAFALPFMAERRVVVYQHPLTNLSSEPLQEKFKRTLERIPVTTALVIIVDQVLTPWKSREKGNFHWLEAWANDHPEIVYIRRYEAQKGGAMVHWIQERAQALGGELEVQAATLLANQVGEDKRLADNELQKLLAYVNYARQIDRDDVIYLTPSAGETNVFAMVDALGNRNDKQASKLLHQLLDRFEPEYIFAMVVRQFRLLLLAKEIVESGGDSAEIVKKLRLHPFVAGKLVDQSRGFSLEGLEEIYHKLVDIDEAIKTSRVDTRLALDTLIASLAL
jgi:DNA polymerase-3 subunit delta